jgi:site-specific recombinase
MTSKLGTSLRSPTSPQQWQSGNSGLITDATSIRNLSKTTRDASDRLRAETDAKLKQRTQQLQSSFSQRVADIKTFDSKLHGAKQALQAQLGRMFASLDQLEAHLDFFRSYPTDVNVENCASRAQRPTTELIRDDVELHLESEQDAILNVSCRCRFRF